MPGFGPAARELYVQLFRIMLITALIFAASFALGEMLVARQRFLGYGLAPVLYNLGIVAGRRRCSARSSASTVPRSARSSARSCT